MQAWSRDREVEKPKPKPKSPKHRGKSVLQPWVESLTFMQQSVLISAVRAPDTLRKTHPAKLLMRWYRRCVLVCAFERVIHLEADEPCGGKYTGAVDNVDQLAQEYLVNVDELPHHFHLHLLHAAEILGYKHPTERVRLWWWDFYVRGVNDMHLQKESVGEMDDRLSDDEASWKARENYPERRDA